MFTGIVKEMVIITALKPVEQCVRVSFSRPRSDQYSIGDSILLDGICSTISAIADDTMAVDYMPQTRRQTTVDTWTVGKKVHCEPPVTLQTKLSGAFVLGHVDTTATIVQCERGMAGTVVTLHGQAAWPPLVMPQGAITINGVNCTIVDCAERSLTVHLIPYTLAHTNFDSCQTGEILNVEFDYIAKLIWTMTQRSTVERSK